MTLIFISYLCSRKWFDTGLIKAIHELVSLNRGLPELIGIVLSEELADFVMRFLQLLKLTEDPLIALQQALF